MKKHSMQSASKVAQQATHDITTFLKNHPSTLSIQNVELDPSYQIKDIDLLWQYKKDGKTHHKTIEIKGDRYHKTGNYFFETISNQAKGTTGCFLYTEADYVFYYFIGIQTLHILPMPKVRDWFVKRLNDFKEQKTSTPVGQDFYVTVGRLVPIKVVLEAGLSVRVIDLKVFLKT